MKIDIKILTLTLLILTSYGYSKTTPMKSNIISNPYIKCDKTYPLKPVNLIKPASLSSDEIDYRELFSLLIRLSL